MQDLLVETYTLKESAKNAEEQVLTLQVCMNLIHS